MTCANRRRRVLRHEIAAALAVKTIALLILYAVFFSSTPQFPDVSRHLFGRAAPAHETEPHWAMR